MKFLDVLKAEFKRVIKDTALMLTVIGGVILYSFLYPQPYLQQGVKKLPLSVVDKDNTQASRDLIFRLNATPNIDIVRKDMVTEDAKKALADNKIKGIFVIPKGYQHHLAQGMKIVLELGVDNSYFLIYGAFLESSLKVVLTQNASLAVAALLKKQVPLEAAKQSFTPYSLNTINLFNKYNSYTQYVIPAVFVLILQQTLLIGMGILGGGINEAMQAGKDGYYNDASVWQMIGSRFIIFGTLFFFHMLYYFGFSFEFFDIIHIGNIGDILLFGCAFLAAILALGIFLSSVFSSREIATPVILFSSLPLVFSAGFVWPLEAMPDFIRYLSYISPSTPAIAGFLELNQLGADFSMVFDKYIILWIQAAIYIILGYYYMDKKKERICQNLKM